MEYIHGIFPNSKFIYMVRDGRAVAYSYMLQVRDKMSALKYRSYLRTWNSFNIKAMNDCKKLGDESCLKIRYEDLVLHPEKTLKKVVKFLKIKWTSELLNHHNHIGKKISVSKTEWSTHQIVYSIIIILKHHKI
jgi:protein-tyrosine sulfotransferase